jgi:hypothetical protein
MLASHPLTARLDTSRLGSAEYLDMTFSAGLAGIEKRKPGSGGIDGPYFLDATEAPL